MTPQTHDEAADRTAPDDAADAPELLRRHRTERGYSQQQLADAARLSVRTVRGLERGSVDNPRADTLVRVGDALGLANADRIRFFEVWGLPEQRRVVAPDDMVLDPDKHADLLAIVRRRKDETSIAFAHDLVSVENRRIVAEDFTRVCVAEVSGVRGTSIVWISDSPSVQRACRIGSLYGCALRRQVVIDEVTTVLELAFRSSLAAGESHLFRYSRSYAFDDDAPVSSPDDPWAGSSSLIGVHRGARVCLVEVRFAPGDRPRRCVYLLVRQLGGAYEQVRDIEVPASGHVQLSVVDPVAGWHGVGWQW